MANRIQAGDAVVKFLGDSKGLDATLERIGKVGRRVGVAMTALGGAITGVSGFIVKMGMDAEESENLFEVSMGGMAEAARKWSEDLSDKLGLNAYQLRENVGMFNTMFESMGIGADKSYEMSTGLVQLAHDMASFYNLRPEEAFEKLQAGITGEVEPLKRLGINLNVAALEQKALDMEIEKGWQDMTIAEQTAVRYAAILDATAKAQGDLERTSGSATNQLRRAKAQFAEAATTVGTQLIPVVTGLLNRLTPVLDKVNAWIQANPELTGTIARVAAGVGILATALGPVLIALPGILAVVGALSWPLLAVGAAVAALGLAWKENFLGIRDVTAAAVAKAKELIGSASDVMAEAWETIKGLWETGKEIVLGAVESIRAGVEDWLATNSETIASFVENLRNVFLPIWDEMKEKFTAAWSAIRDFWAEISPELKNSWSVLVEFLKVNLEDFMGFWNEHWQTIQDVLKTALAVLETGIQVAWETFKTIIRVALDVIQGNWSGAWDNIKNYFTQIGGILEGGFNYWVGVFKATWEGFTTWLSDKVSWVFDKVSSITDAVANLPGAALDFITGGDDGGFAYGGMAPASGRYLVGEVGPEVVTLPQGAEVTPNKDLGRGGSGGGITLNFHGISGAGEVERVVRRLAREGLLASV